MSIEDIKEPGPGFQSKSYIASDVWNWVGSGHLANGNRASTSFVQHDGMHKALSKYLPAVAALATAYGLLWISTYFLEQPSIMFALGLAYGFGMVGLVAVGIKKVEAGPSRPWQDKTGLVGCSIGVTGIVIYAIYLCWSVWDYSPYYARTPLIAAGMIYAPGGLVGMGLAALIAINLDYRRVS